MSSDDADDIARVRFPSDSIELGQLRRRLHHDHDAVGVFVHDLILLETEVAANVMRQAAARGAVPDRIARVLQNERASQLAGLYVQAGLVSGEKEARELVKRFQSEVKGRHK